MEDKLFIFQRCLYCSRSCNINILYGEYVFDMSCKDHLLNKISKDHTLIGEDIIQRTCNFTYLDEKGNSKYCLNKINPNGYNRRMSNGFFKIFHEFCNDHNDVFFNPIISNGHTDIQYEQIIQLP